MATNNEDALSVTLTIRLMMQGREVGSIIGKKGEIINKLREASGAKINISDLSCPERIVTVSGTIAEIFAAFTLITTKFEEWCTQFTEGTKNGKAQIPIRLIVPASQCGSLIGKNGSKIKEMRQSTGCSIQVASDMLPNSTERTVTLSGTPERIAQCIYQICQVMLESPPRGATIPYRPKPLMPVILGGNAQAYGLPINYAVPAQDASVRNPLASLTALGLATQNTTGLNSTAALAALAGSQLRTVVSAKQQQEMTVSNELIGCIIGKGGTKIAEIRQISGAMIRISNCEEREDGNTDRTITISGTTDAVKLAQYLINMSIEMQKANLQKDAAAAAVTDNGNKDATPPTTAISQTGKQQQALDNTSVLNGSTSPNVLAAAVASNPATLLASAIPLAQLLTKPGTLHALSSLSALGGLTELLSGFGTLKAPPVQTTGVHRSKNYAAATRMRNATSIEGGSDGDTEKMRNRFNPY